MPAALAAAGFAQSTVLPARASTTPGNSEDGWMLYGASTRPEARVQYLFDASQLPAAPGALRSMWVRRATSVQVALPATTVDLTLTLSQSAVGWTQASAAFAANLGPNAVQVFAGQVSMAARGPSPAPAPWESPIVFTVPFPHNGASGGSLVLDVVARNASAPWLVEAFEPLPGSRTTEWDPSQCTHSGGFFNNQISFQVPTIGGEFWVDHFGMPANVPSFALSAVVIGRQGSGGTFGGMPLPLNPGNYGVPTRPGCQLAIDVMDAVPVTYRPGGSSGALLMPHLPMPSMAGLAGGVFYTQPVSVDTDPGSGALQLYTGWANRWVVGPVAGVPATTVVSPGDASAPTGTVYLGRSAVVRFDP